jgi:tetratricopeptide (TPR) repeat protein
MVIGFLNFQRPMIRVLPIVLAVTVLTVRAMADDQIVKTDGSIVAGTITGASADSVTIQTKTASGGIAKFPVMRSDIKTINMVEPPAIKAAQAPGIAPADVITQLGPVVQQYAGLPVAWIVTAMAQLADAYNDSNQADKAAAIYTQIQQLYPNSSFSFVAQAGIAAMDLKAGKVPEALQQVQPIVDQANKNIAPSPTDGALYARAFIVYGQILEAQQKPQQALEAYLTVTTMLYQNQSLVDQAKKLADDLRAKQPKDFGVE